MRDGAHIELTGGMGFYSKPNPKASLNALSDGSKNVCLGAEGSLETVPDIGTVALTQAVNAGSNGRRAYLHGGKRAFASSPGNSTETRGGLAAFVGASGGNVRWEGAGPFSYLASYIISITNGTGDAPLGLPVPPALTASATDPPPAGQYYISAGGNIKKSVALKISLYRKETNSESWLSQGTGPIVVAGSGVQIKVTAPAVPVTYDVGTFYIRIYATPQGFGASPLAQYYRVAEISPSATVTLNFTDADLGALAPYTADSPSGTWTDPTTNPGKYGMPPAATWVAATGAHLLAIGCYDPPTGHLFHPSVAFSIDTFDPTTVGVANPTEPFLDVLENANDGYIIGCHKNAIGAFVQTGAADYPVIYRNLFRGIGVASKGQICTMSGEIVMWAIGRGLLRSGAGDQPDTTWTFPVRAFMSGFTSTPLVGYDPATDRTVVIGNHSDPFNGAGAAWVKIAYERGLPGDIWTAPDEITGFTPVSVETWDNNLYLVDASGNWRKAYGGSTSRNTVAQFAPQTGGMPGHRKTVTEYEYSASADCDVAITYGRANAVGRSHSAVAREAEGSSGWQNTLVNNKRLVSMKLTRSTGGTIDGGGLKVGIEDGVL